MDEDCTETYNCRALAAIGEAAITEHDFAGWLAGVLARAAAARGGSYALVAGRPGSWEAHIVLDLVRRTVGWDDELLADYVVTGTAITGPADPRTAHPGTDRTPPG